jgi:lipid-binding SYLF domain-containing protein
MLRQLCLLILSVLSVATSVGQANPALSGQSAPTESQQQTIPADTMEINTSETQQAPAEAPAASGQTAPAVTQQQSHPTDTVKIDSTATQQQTAPSETPPSTGQAAAPAASSQSSTTSQQAAPATQQTTPATTEKAAPATTQEATPTAKQPAKNTSAQQAQQSEDEQDTEDTAATVRPKIEDRLRESREIMKELISGKANIPSSILEKSKCIIVIPGVKKFAITVGGSYGRGNMTCRSGQNFNGRWSAPAMYALEGGNFGLQIGLQGTDLVLVVMNDRGVDSLLRSKFRIGGDAAVAAGPIGRNAQAATDIAMRAQILSYSRSRGIFAGISLEGSTLRPDNNANYILYGRDLTARQIVRGGLPTPAPAKDFIAFMDKNLAPRATEASTTARTERDK